MAKDRVQVRDLSDAPALTPQAAPVDTYHQPNIAPPRDYAHDEMAQLAGALSDFAPALHRFNQQIVAPQSVEEGRALAAQNKLQFKDAVDRGLISPGMNPWLAHGYKEQIQSLNAENYDSALRQSWTKSGVSESDDPKDFQTFVSNFTDHYVKNLDLTNDPTFNQVFIPAMQRSQANLLQQHTEYRQQRIVQQAGDATYKNIQSILDGRLLYQSPEALASTIKQNVDGMIQQGLPGSLANKTTADAIADKAIEEGRNGGDGNSILDIGKLITTNTGPLGKTQYAQDRFREAQQHIFTLQREKDSYEWATRERNLKLIGDNLRRQTFERLEKDPHADLSDLVGQANKIDPEVSKALQEYKDFKLTQGVKVHEDSGQVAQLFNDIHQGKDVSERLLSLGAAHELDPQTISRAYERMDLVAKHKDVLEAPEIVHLGANIEKALSQGGTKFDNTTALRVSDAQNIMSQGLLDYAENHPQAGRGELFTEGVRLQQLILKSIPETAESGTSLPPTIQGRVNQEVGAKPVKALFESKDDLAKAIEEHNTTQGNGRLAHYAEALGVDVPSLIKAQKAALTPPKK